MFGEYTRVLASKDDLLEVSKILHDVISEILKNDDYSDKHLRFLQIKLTEWIAKNDQ